MMIIESRQSFTNTCESYDIPLELVASKTRRMRKLTLMKLMARVLSKVSMAIFCLQGLYPEIRSPLPAVILLQDNTIIISTANRSSDMRQKPTKISENNNQLSRLVGARRYQKWN